MADMVYNEEGFLQEPCLSCDKSHVEFILHEWCCDEKVCPYQESCCDKKVDNEGN